jgi:ribosome-associated protein
MGNRRSDDLSPEMKREPATTESGVADSGLRGPRRRDESLDIDAAAQLVLTSLEDDKAEDIVSIDIRGKSSLADVLVVASGRSARHVGALADHVMRKLKEFGVKEVKVEGLPQGDWVLVDAGDIVVHLFRPEVRSFYNIEKIWLGGGGPSSALPS